MITHQEFTPFSVEYFHTNQINFGNGSARINSPDVLQALGLMAISLFEVDEITSKPALCTKKEYGQLTT